MQSNSRFRRRIRLAGVLAMTAMAAGMNAAQARDQELARAAPQATGTGLIAGTVTSADSGRPLAGVAMVLTEQSSGARRAMTDEVGQFKFDDLPAGVFRLDATKAGYLDTQYGQHEPGSGRPGLPIRLGASQQITDVSLALPRGGGISGTVTNEHGEPLTGIDVSVLEASWETGRERLTRIDRATTDDRGQYRVGPLPPGAYVVAAAPRETATMAAVMVRMMAVERAAAAAAANGERVDVAELEREVEMAARNRPPPVRAGMAPTYFPGVTTASSAQPIVLGAGEEREGLDIRLQPLRLGAISGRVIDASGEATRGEVRVVDVTGGIQDLTSRAAPVAPDGTFELGSLPPARYFVSARRTIRVPAADEGGRASTYALWALDEISIGETTLTDLQLGLREGARIGGHLELTDSGTTLPRGATVTVTSLEPDATTRGLRVGAARVDDEGRFSMRSVPPGRYRIDAKGLGADLHMTSAYSLGIDVLDAGLGVEFNRDQTDVALTISSRVSELTGLVQDAAGASTNAYTVVVFSEDPQFWTPQSRRIAAQRTATDGRYQLRGLPAGAYRLAAVYDPEPGRWFDPDYLRELTAASIRVTIVSGERRAQDVRVAR